MISLVSLFGFVSFSFPFIVSRFGSVLDFSFIFICRDITLPTKVCLVKAMVFSSGHVWMRELDCEEN